MNSGVEFKKALNILGNEDFQINDEFLECEVICELFTILVQVVKSIFNIQYSLIDTISLIKVH